MNKVTWKPFNNKVESEVVKIKSEYSFVSPYQSFDTPKER